MANDHVRDLVQGLIADDVHLYVSGSELRYRARKGAIGEADKKRVKENKTAIIDYLNKLQQMEIEQTVALPPVERVERENGRLLPLSFSQQRLWFIDQMGVARERYNMPGSYLLAGELDVAAFERALQSVLERHEVLRTHIVEQDGEPRQAISSQYALPWQLHDLSRLTDTERAREVKRLMREEAQTPFDLSRDLMLRVRLVKLSQNHHLVLHTMHHIASDGWSLGILRSELGALYAAYSSGKENPLQPLTIQYADFAQWQRKWLQGEVLAEQLSYWQDKLAELPPLLTLPLDRPRPAEQTFRGRTECFALPSELLEKMKALSRERGATLYMTLLSAFAVLLGRYAGQQDVAIGTPITNRRRRETEGLIGLLLNTLVMRHDLSGDPSFVDFLKRTRITALQAFEHQDIPFEYLVEKLNPQRSLSHSPLFQVMFVLQNTPMEALELPGMEVRPLHEEVSEEAGEGAAEGIARFDLTLSLQETPSGLAGGLEYNTDVFDRSTVRRMLAHYARLLEAIVEAPQSRLSQLEMLSGQERQRQLIEWNATSRAYPDNKCIHELFEAQARQRPDQIALMHEGCELTYGELSRRASRLAHQLIERGVGPEVRVGLCLPRSFEMVIGILGILKAGGCYVPLDPDYPRKRLDYLLEDARIELIVTGQSVAERVTGPGRDLLLLTATDPLDVFASDTWEGPDSRALGLRPEHPAYLIYTSASTGTPKGVLGLHRSIVNRVNWLAGSLGTDEVLCQKTSLGFVDHVAEIFQALSAGVPLLIIAPEVLQAPHQLLRELDVRRVTQLTLVPSLLKTVLDAGQGARARWMKSIHSSGEALHLSGLEKIAQCFPRARLLNIYGSTEMGADVTCHEVAPHSLQGAGQWAPIGKGIDNTQAYILDADGQLAAPGAVGELHIGGVCLARGYFNRAGLTAQKFVPHPFSAEPGARLYRTGDMARCRPDGSLEYLGRKDHQVKIRGFRIELGEIESVLRAHEGVREAVVVAREDAGDKRLVGYVVVKSDAQADEVALIQALRGRLQAQLPGYMVPSALMVLERLPLTTNGKVDREALPDPKASVDAEYKPPEGVTEELLAQIWSLLLKRERVGRHDNFFELGGHSLLATQLVSRIRETFSTELPVRKVFEHPTPSSQALAVERARGAGALIDLPMEAVSREQPLPLSYAQQRLWFTHQYMGPSAVYNMPLALRLRGEVNGAALVRSLKELQRRHESLRTRFETHDGSAMQVVDPPDLELEIEAVSPVEGESIARAECNYCFDLSRDRLCRIRLLRETDSESGDCLLLVTMHHIVSDGWSLGVFFRELTSLYQAYANGEESPLAPLPIQYADYAQWQRGWLQGRVLAEQMSYWQDQLVGLPPLLTLPTDRPRPAEQTFRGRTENFALPLVLLEKMKALSREQGATLYMTLLSAFALLLGRYAGQQDVAIGTPIANRTRRETEGLIGYFVNTLVMRHDLAGDPRFVDALKRTCETALQAYAHQDVPFEQLIESLNPERTLSHPPLFQVMFALQNAPAEAPELPGLALLPLNAGAGGEDEDAPEGTARFDLAMALQETPSGLAGGLEYNTDLFDRSTVRRMLDHYARLLAAIVDAPQSRLSQLEMLSEQEKQQQLIEWNATSRAYPDNKCIHELFEQQAEQTPDRIALVFEGSELTYAELNRRANALAHELIQRGVGPEVRVGLCLPRSAEMVIGILGILKAGGCYVPLDRSYPHKRLAHIVQDSGLAWVVGDSSQWTFLDAGDRPCCVPVIDNHGSERSPQTNPENYPPSSSAAYAIYTSGSTGVPKGVRISHRNVVNFLRSMQEEMCLGARDRLLAVTTPSFDIAVLELCLPLTVGGTVDIAPLASVADGERLMARLEESRITLLQGTPATWKLLLDSGWEGQQRLTALVGGEAFSRELATRIVGKAGRVWNLYGPTETTIWSTRCRVSVAGETGTVPIGQPLANTRVYVLDRHQQLLPMGVAGELCVGGVGVSQGYLNRPALTAEKFVPDPFGNEPGERLYRTADLVRWLADGTLEFLGRVDTQVKVRGYRIELGEIESVVLTHEAVRDAVVVARNDDGDTRLVGYVVAKAGIYADHGALIQALRSRLQEELPAYMVPPVLMVLEDLPLTANGKVDRKALPEPQASVDVEYAPPNGMTEELLAQLWCVLLKCERVGRHDNFFGLGGHSLLATQLVSRIRETLSIDLPVRQVFEHPTLSSQAGAIERAKGASPKLDLPLEAISRDEPLALSYAQQRLWFLHQYLGPSAVYNMPLALRLRGETNEAALVRSLQELERRHESLRTRFETYVGSAIQVIDPPDLDLEIEVVSPAEVETIALSESNHRFDLSRERLCRIRLLRERDTEDHAGDYVLLVTMHHSVSDGWSLGVFFRELTSLYQAYANGEQSPLAPLPIQYADFAQWQRRWLQGGVLERQVSYWRKQLEDLPALLSLPTDRPRPTEQTFRGRTEHFALPAALSEKLQALSREQGATLYMTLLSAFAVLLGRYSGQQDVAVGTPIANRTRRETEGLIGFFVNTLVMRHDLSDDPCFVDVLRRTRETALEAYEHQDIPFEQLIEKLNPERTLSHSPLFQVMFIMQNAPFETLELPGFALQPLNAGAAGKNEDTPEATARFDLTLTLTETPAGLMGGLEYNTDLFDRGTIRRLLGHYARLLEAIVDAPRARLSRLDFLGEEEKRQQLLEWNATTRAYPQERCIHELFEAQARQLPDQIALMHEGRELTYGELNRRANGLAHELTQRGVGPEVRVGLCLPRSLEMVIGILGILKAGGAYVPLDPDYPRQRLDYLLEDAQIELVVTEPTVATRMTSQGREFLMLNGMEPLMRFASDALEVPDTRAPGLHPEHPAYLIYTSASTGVPKGVVGSHRSIVNRVNWLARFLGVGADEVLCQKTSLGFVDHVAEIFQALSAGVPLAIIAPSVLLSPQQLLRQLDARRVTQLTLVPSLLKTVLEAGRGERARSLRSIYSSGEALHSSGLERLGECFPRARLFNIYGSTEIGADVTCHEVSAECLRSEGGQWVPIGRGIDNTQAYILDGEGQLAVSGSVGELHVGGVCLARGYFNRAGLTAQKFVPHPFSLEPGARLYRTGDRARWRADGSLEFQGRIDTQVKIRGFRIELGEIESMLLAHKEVRDVVVVTCANSGGSPQLVAYVAKSGVQTDDAVLQQQLRSYLEAHLPRYMVPAAFMLLTNFPLTAHGKVDRKALPAPEALVPDSEYMPPDGPTEELMADIWCALLKRERVGRHDNFFQLGGHSMLAVRLVHMIRQEFATELPLHVIFESPTVASLSKRFSTAQESIIETSGAEWVTGSM